MVSRRKPTKKSKFLGRRHFGVGNAKNRRGSGNRGGRGNAGLHKHKFSWVTLNDPDYFGKSGFVRPGKKKVPTVNLYEIDRKAILNKLDKKEGKFYFEFKGKILSTGSVTVPVSVKALSWSKNAEEKIKNAGGDINKFEQANKN
ncbi:uL15 family ribosomal protein [Candidatus Micrarchaeota archaeon]|nr:uL15 family ribosomal protein [Candidatus Micrarchaeota archaeon]